MATYQKCAVQQLQQVDAAACVEEQERPKAIEKIKASSASATSSAFATLRAVAAEELDLVLERLPRHPRFAEIPTALRDWLLPIDWDRERLWALDLPRRRLELKELRWHLDLPWWRHEGVWFHLTPREFLAAPTAHPEHADRVGSADLSYPLHVVPRHRRWLILDGIHRLVKAKVLGLTDVLVSTLTPADIVKVARPHPWCTARGRM